MLLFTLAMGDACNVMNTNRIYRPALRRSYARSQIHSEGGTEFDSPDSPMSSCTSSRKSSKPRNPSR
jgi:hypothetical protein